MQKAMRFGRLQPQQPQGRRRRDRRRPGLRPARQSILQQQAMQERRAKMQQTQEAVFRRNLSEEEYAIVAKAHAAEMQSQKRVTVYKVGATGDLESRTSWCIGLSRRFERADHSRRQGRRYVRRPRQHRRQAAQSKS
jgi:hypothetical protein